jgi:hypothetical protein
MADLSKSTDGPEPYSAEGYDSSLLPDFDHEFLSYEDVIAFANALSAPEPSPSTDDLTSTVNSLGGSEKSPDGTRRPSVASIGTDVHSERYGETNRNPNRRESIFITAQNDWAPVNPPRRNWRKSKEKNEGKTKARRRKPRRSRDETREGYLYTLLKWPFLWVVGAWVIGLAISYLLTRLYIWLYEHFIAWRGKRERLRRSLQEAENYSDWVRRAKDLDEYLGNDKWREDDTFAYYDSKTVKRVVDQLRKVRRRVTNDPEGRERGGTTQGGGKKKAIDDLKVLVEACVKSNFVGVENSRLYSQTYYGTKNLVQQFVDEGSFRFSGDTERLVLIFCSRKSRSITG